MKHMKKLMLVLSGCLMFFLAVPVFAQDAGTQAPAAQKKDTKAEAKDTNADASTKTQKKTKKAKAKTTDQKKTDEAPKQ